MRSPGLTLTSIALLLSSSSILLAQGQNGTFTNGNFETGDFTGWTQGAGVWGSPNEWPTGVLDASAFVPGGNKYNIAYNASSVIAGPAQADPRTDGKLNPIYNGKFTAQVNDPLNNNSVSVISQTVANYTAPHIFFAWAAVLQASHGLTDSDNFTLKLTDDTTHETLYQVRYNSADAAQATLFSHSTADWFYTSWQLQDLDVSTRVGHTFTLLLLAADCPYGGHAGYVYLDGFGAVTPPSGTITTGNPLSIGNSADLGTFTQGSTVSGSLAATGGTAPYTWSTGGNLPAGFTVTDGTFSGTAGVAGNYRITLVVTDSTGSSAAASLSYSVFGVTSTTLPDVVQFSPYFTNIGIAGGTQPYLFTAKGLPPGLTITNTGVIQGTTTVTGSSTVTVTVTDADGRTFSAPFTLRVAAPLPLKVTSTSLKAGGVGAVYANSVTATGGAAPYSWSLVSGTLPAGLTFHSSGSITGIPAATGTSSFVVRVTDVTGASVTGGVTLAVAPTSLTVLNPSPFANGVSGIDYPVTLFGASGGTGPYSFAVTSGALPTGLTLSSAGQLSGVPRAVGNFPFTVTVTDAAGNKATASPGLTIRPLSTDLILSAGSLVFNSVSGSVALPPQQNVTVQSTDPAVPLRYTTTVSAGANWLTVSPGANTPGTIQVSLNDTARQLAGGTTPYQATVSVNCVSPSPCAGSSQSFLVALNVNIGAPALAVSSDLLSFTGTPGSGAGMSQPLGLQNTGGGAVGIGSVTCGASWCSVNAIPAFINSGVLSALNVTVNPAGLRAGYYRTTLEIRASTGTYSVPVTMFISAGPAISLQPQGVQFSSVTGGFPVGGPNSFYVTASGTGSIAWSASVLPGSTWLRVTTPSGNSSGSTPGIVTFSIDQSVAGGLAPGAYYGRIRVTSAGAALQDFVVVLNIAPTGTPQRPSPNPQGLLFITSATTPPPAQAVQIATGSPSPTNFQASPFTNSGGSWLSLNAATGTATPGQPVQSLVSVNPTGLAAGVYYGGVNYAFSGSGVATVNVTLIVTAAGSGINGTGRTTTLDLPLQTGSCAAKILVPAQVGLVNNFAAPTAWPTPLMLQVVSDCGTPVAGTQVVATFSNGDAPLALSLTNGQTGLYSATWTPRHPGAQVTVSARATAPGLPSAVTTLSGTVTPNAVPLINAHSTLHVFDPEVGAGLGPGTIVQLYGQFLAPQVTAAQSVPLAKSLSGTSVLIGGVEAPLFFVSPGQINAQIPFELATGQQYQVIVNANGALSTPEPIQLTDVSPGVAQLPDGIVIAQHGDGSLVSEQSPAKPKEALVMYVAGLGMTDNPVVTGAASPSLPLARPLVAPRILIGGNPTDVQFVGLTPGLVGLYQVNFQVPASASNGDLDIVFTQGGLQGNTTLLPVHN